MQVKNLYKAAPANRMNSMGRIMFALCNVFALFVCFNAHAFEVIKKNAGWCWYQGERAIAAGDSIIFASVKSPEGDIDITSWNLKTGETKTKTLDTHFNSDDHATPGLLQLPDGRVLAAWNSHYNAFDPAKNLHMFYTKTLNGTDISEWEHVKSLKNGGCYNNLIMLPDENNRIYNFTRAAGFNPNWHYSDDMGETFPYGGRLIKWKFDPKDPKKTKLDGNRPYPKYASNGRDKIHIATTEDHPRAYDNSIYHAYIKGGNIYHTDGALVGPLSKDGENGPSPLDLTTVFEGDTDHVAWTMDVREDKNGRLAILFSVQENYGYLRETMSHQAFDLRYYYAVWDGGKWNVHNIANAGTALYEIECDYTGLGSLDPNDVNRVYISTNSDPQTGRPLVSAADGKRRYEIFRGVTEDGGSTWAWTPITENSNCDNLRPIVPVGDADKRAVIWLRGKFIDYCRYDLDAVGFIDEK